MLVTCPRCSKSLPDAFGEAGSRELLQKLVSGPQGRHTPKCQEDLAMMLLTPAMSSRLADQTPQFALDVAEGMRLLQLAADGGLHSAAWSLATKLVLSARHSWPGFGAALQEGGSEVPFVLRDLS